jgi:hypothetical protein
LITIVWTFHSVTQVIWIQGRFENIIRLKGWLWTKGHFITLLNRYFSCSPHKLNFRIDTKRYILQSIVCKWPVHRWMVRLVVAISKPESCINLTLNKPESCIIQTLNKPEFCINQTLYKPESCINWTLNIKSQCRKSLYNFTCSSWTTVYHEHTCKFIQGLVYTGFWFIQSSV